MNSENQRENVWKFRGSLLTAIGLVVSLTASGGLVQRSQKRPGHPAGRSSTALKTEVPLPFNLYSSSVDLNNIALSPRWGTQVSTNTFPDPDTRDCPTEDYHGISCSSQNPTLDKPRFPHSLICGLGGTPPNRAHGHVNWTPATYEGTICFNDYSDDEDLTWSFKPLGGAGLTTRNPVGPSGVPEFFHIEFNAPETVNGFITATWSQLREAFECSDQSAPSTCPDKLRIAREMVDGRRAVVTGLLGLDSEHGGYSEVHPVYAIAIEINPNPHDDTWLLFIRNRGNEGFCSQYDHPLPPQLNVFNLLIPKPLNSTVSNAEVIASDFSTTSNTCAVVGFDSTNLQGEIIQYQFSPSPRVPKPFSGPILEGEIHIRWISTSPLTPFSRVACPGVSARDNDVDEKFLTPEQRQQYRQRRNAGRVKPLASPAFHRCSLTPLTGLPVPRLSQRHQIRAASTKSSAIREYYDQMTRDLCQAATGTLQGCEEFNKWFSKAPKRRKP